MSDVYAKIGKVVLEKLTQEGVIDHRILRNERIKEMNEGLKLQGIGYEERIRIISQQLFSTPTGEKYCLGEKAIEKIIKKEK